MATVSQVTEAVYRGRYEDQMSAGAKAATEALKQNTAAVVENEQKVTAATRSASTWVNKTDEVTRATKSLETAQKQLATARETLTRGVAAGEVTDAQAARAIAALEANVAKAQTRVAALSAAYGQATPAVTGAGTAMAASAVHAERLANQTQLTSRQMAQLAPQLNDIAVQLAGGQSPFLIMMQQGGQITPIFGGIGATLRAFAGALGTVGLAAVGAASALAVMFSALNTQQSALAELRGSLRAVPGDYAAMAREVEASAQRLAASVPGLSRADARSSLVTLSQGAAAARLGFSAGDLEQLVRSGQDLARVLGTDLEDAMRRLAQGMRDPAAMVADLAQRGFPGFDQALRANVQQLMAEGREVQAVTAAFGPLRDRIQGAGQDVGPLEQATRRLTQAWEQFKQAIGPTLVNAATAVLDVFTRLASVSGVIAEAIGRMGGSEVVRLIGSLVGGGARAGTATNPGGPVGGLLAEAGQIAGLDPGFLAIIQRMENRQRADGTWPTSPAGAVGPMQVMPGTFAELARRYGLPGDVGDERSNVIAGALYLRELIDRFNGDVRAAVAAYNAGPGRVEGVAGNFDRLPRETRDYLARFEPQWVVTQSPVTGPLNRGLITAPAAPTATLPPTVVTAPAPGVSPTSTESALDRALRLASGDLPAFAPGSSIEAQQAGLARGLREIEEAMRGVAQGSVEWDRLSEGARRFREQIASTITPAEQLERQLRLQGASAGIVEQAQRTLTQRMAEYDETVRRSGRPADAEARARYQAEQIRQINAELSASITLTERASTAQGRIADAYLRSEQAGRRQELVERALREVRNQGVLTQDEQIARVNQMVAALEREQRATANLAAAQQAARLNRDADIALRERELITSRNREVEMAGLNAQRNILNRPGGTLNSPEAQAEIAAARNLARMQQENQQLQNSWNELANGAERSFDRIGTAITEAMVQGRMSMASLANVARGIVSELIQQFMRLAILNPILNSLFGGKRGTMGGILDLLGMGASAYAGGGWGQGQIIYSSPIGPGYARGGAFNAGMEIHPFAYGGVVDSTRVVPMAMMGEAGPEAIMPLRRGKDGKLGVASDGAAAAPVINMGDIHVEAPADTKGAGPDDPAAAERLATWIAAQIKVQVYEVLTKELRGGGALSMARA